MKTTHFLVAAAIFAAFACSKSDQASSDGAASAAKSAGTPDSAAVADMASAEAAAAAPATPSATAGTPAGAGGAAGGTAAGARAAAKEGAPPAKAGAAAVAEAAAVPSKPEAKGAAAAAAPVAVAAPAAATAVDPSTGKLPYEENCRKCHGVIGVPPKAMKTKFPKLIAFDAEFFAKRSDDSVVKVLTNGGADGMLSFKDKLSRQEMAAVAAYMRTFGGAR